MMRRALALAERGWGQVAPNPLVGAVVVRDGEVVGEGWHARFGAPHAEVHALEQAGGRARGATLYVSLEPCAHSGKTPPCTDAVLRAGVERVVIGATDPNPVAAGGAERLRKVGLAVVTGVEEQAVRDLDPAFFHRFGPATDRPFVALKLALSLDGRIADARGRSAWITGEEARAEVQRLRAGFDAVAVGIGTALADDPRLTVRGAVVPRNPPVRVVWDRALRLPLHGRLVRSAAEAPVWVLADPAADEARQDALERAGVRVLRAAGTNAGLRALREAGVGAVLAEGGAGLAAALLDGEVVDRLFLFYAPLLLGPGSLSPFAVADAPLDAAKRWRTVGVDRFGPDTLLTLAAEPLPCSPG